MRVLSVTRRIVQVSSVNPAFEEFQALPGIGMLSASAYVNTIGNGKQFECGRQVSAWLGLVPRQYGSGGQLQLKGITRSEASIYVLCYCRPANPKLALTMPLLLIEPNPLTDFKFACFATFKGTDGSAFERAAPSVSTIATVNGINC